MILVNGQTRFCTEVILSINNVDLADSNPLILCTSGIRMVISTAPVFSVHNKRSIAKLVSSNQHLHSSIEHAALREIIEYGDITDI